MGQIITKLGVYPNRKNIDAIIRMEQPKNKSGVLRLLGLMRYSSQYIANLSE